MSSIRAARRSSACAASAITCARTTPTASSTSGRSASSRRRSGSTSRTMRTQKARSCRTFSRAWAERLRHFAQLSALDLVDEPTHGVLLRDERAGFDPRDRLPDVLLQVVERLRRPLGLDSGFLLHLAAELVVAEGEHAAVGVVDQHDLLGSEEALRDCQRADLVIGDYSAGVADHMRVALVQPE